MYQNLPTKEMKLENETSSNKSSKVYLESRDVDDVYQNAVL
jgi:hypothetical protein